MKPTNHKYTLLHQVCAIVSPYLVPSLATEHGVDKQARTFSPWSHVVSMLFAHISHALSLNDICGSLRLHAGVLATIRGATPPSRNGLSHANRTRNAELAKDIFYEVLLKLTNLYPKFGRIDASFKLPRGLKKTVNLVDSTVIQLFANCMDWAKHRRQKAAAKCHMCLDARTFLPRFAIVQEAASHDAVAARSLCKLLRDGEIVVFDRAYVDYEHLHELSERGVLWVTHSKTNMSYRVAKKRKITNKSIVRDEKIKLKGVKSKSDNPDYIRLIEADVVCDGEIVRMKFMTNDFSLATSTTADLYKLRWEIESFFKQIKQTLKLSGFLGYSENAVKWQRWTALLCYLILRFIAYTNKWQGTFSRLFTLVRGVMWSRIDMRSLLKCCGTAAEQKRLSYPPEQLYLALFTP